MMIAQKINSLDDLIPNKENQEYLCQFKEDNWTFDYYICIGGNNLRNLGYDASLMEGGGLLVFFPSAQTKKETRMVPFFNRASWSKQISNYNVVSVSDPTIRLPFDLIGGWFLGNKHEWVLKKVIRHIIYIALKLKCKKVLYHGSSLGGFVALQSAIISTIFNKDLFFQVFAEIPQINLLFFIDCNKHTNQTINKLLQICNYPYNSYRYDTVELMKKYNYVPNGLIVIKESDTHHYNVHIKYLLDNIPAQQRNNLKIEVIPASIDNTGHTPLNLEQFKQRLEYLDIMANMYKNYDKYYY